LHIISTEDGSEILEKKYKNEIVAPVIVSDSLAVLIINGERLIIENWVNHQTIWEADLNGSFLEPLVMDSLIFWVDGKNYVRCHRLYDGTRVWDRKLDHHCSCTLTGFSGSVVLAGDEGVIQCLESTSGNAQWSYDTGRRMRNPPICINGDLIFCGTEGNIGRLEASKGSLIWKTDIHSPIMAPAAADGKSIYIGTNDRYIYRIDFASGAVVWGKNIGGPVKAGPTLTDETAIFVGIDFVAYFVDKISGEVTYRFKANGMLTTRPLVCDGRVYIAAEDRNLYCFDISGDTK
jgi:outer membrane protein assembly factor BamB